MKKEKGFDQRLLDYSLTAGLILALRLNAIADPTVYNVNITLADGVPNDYVAINFDGGTFTTDTNTPNHDLIVGFRGASWFTANRAGVSFIVKTVPSYFRAVPLNSSNSVPANPSTALNPTYAWTPQNSVTLGYSNTTVAFGGKANKYLGVRFGTPGNYHYGWVKLSVNSDATEATVHSFAYESALNTPIGSPLPVELKTFDAVLNGTSVDLNWETAIEVNNYGFEIQTQVSSSEYQEWTNVGFVLGNGTTNSPKQYSFTDTDLPNADEVNYRLKQIDNDGTFTYSKIVTVDLSSTTGVEDNIKYEFALQQNYPNPFNPSTTIKFTVPSEVKGETSNVKLIVYDMLGRKVATLIDETKSSGIYEVQFDASNLSSGMYFYKLSAGSFVQTKKMLLIK